ncbi:MAG TPA: glycosyltransferase [Pyrinomonadaceae bacterium]|nr:glycosyltransferase [Pyrinomonadaceae bacterium]
MSSSNELSETKRLSGRRALFISYNGMLDPLGQSQVLPYLRQLSQRGVAFTLLSFEREAQLNATGEAGINALRASLTADGIEWHWLRYHQTPSLLATAYDVAHGVRVAKRLVKKNGIELVHARSHIPVTIAMAIKKRLPVKIIFDVRGLMAEEYVDANHWRKDSLPYTLTKAMERRAFATAEGVVTLTNAIWKIIKNWDGLRQRPEIAHQVVPCCADLDLFQFSESDRQRRRNELGLNEEVVLVYSGSIDGWYLTEQMADFFSSLLGRRSDAHALWLTPAKHERIHELMTQRNVDEGRYSVRAALPRDVPSYLSASDVGVAFIKPCFSKLASSPTKYAEYLACGLPLVINAGIGDSDSLITEEHAGALVHDFSETDFEEAAKVIEPFSANKEETRRLTREIAERLFDVGTVGVERYAKLYEDIM